MDRERDGSAYFMSPLCRCGSRKQKNHGASVFECLSCGRWNFMRVTAFGYVALSQDVAESMDRMRKERVA